MQFQPGYRLNLMDVAFSLFIIVTAIGVWGLDWRIAIMCATAGFQFFLFCNVFRIRRVPELIWAAMYSVVSYLSITNDWSMCAWAAIWISIGLGLIVNEMRHPGYHGVLWKRINPNLESWFSENVEKKA
jgi:hypothetical protein